MLTVESIELNEDSIELNEDSIELNEDSIELNEDSIVIDKDEVTSDRAVSTLARLLSISIMRLSIDSKEEFNSDNLPSTCSKFSLRFFAMVTRLSLSVFSPCRIARRMSLVLGVSSFMDFPSFAMCTIVLTIDPFSLLGVRDHCMRLHTGGEQASHFRSKASRSA
jgi:hypothetical protein